MRRGSIQQRWCAKAKSRNIPASVRRRLNTTRLLITFVTDRPALPRLTSKRQSLDTAGSALTGRHPPAAREDSHLFGLRRVRVHPPFMNRLCPAEPRLKEGAHA